MTNEDREKVFRTLMGTWPNMHQEDVAELADICLSDMEALEPVIDALCEQAFRRGKFEAYLEEAERYGKILERSQNSLIS